MPSALCCSVTRVAPLLEHFLGLDCLFHRTCASFPVNSASNPELFSPRRLSSCSLDGLVPCVVATFFLPSTSRVCNSPAVCRCRSWRLPVPVPIVMASFRLGCQFVIPLALLSTLLALRSLLRLRLVFASVPVSWPAHLYSCFSSLMFVRTPNSDLLHGLSLELSWHVPLAALFPVCLRVLSWTSAVPSPFRPI
jgi:hypothetical protein